MINSRDRSLIAIIFIALILSIIYMVKSILAPFLFALIIAFFLHPLVDLICKKKKISRLSAALIIMGVFFLTVIMIGMILVPLIYFQFLEMIDIIPGYFNSFVTTIYPKIAFFLNKAGFNLNTDYASIADNQEITSPLLAFLKNMAMNLVKSTVTLVNILAFIFITPILVFYLVKDWNLMIAKINEYMPARSSSLLSRIAKDIRATIGGYVRGQANACMILSLYYSLALSLTGLNFGFLIGFFTGIFSCINYVGNLTSFIIAITVALFQWGGHISDLAPIILIYIIGQSLDSNFLTPKLIGQKVGLHPFWIIFGLFFFGALFGFLGILFSTPLTAICGVLIRNIAIEYKKKFI